MEEQVLPVGWEQVFIGDLCEVIEQRIPSDNERFLYIDIGSIDRDLKAIISPTEMTGVDAPSRARKVVREGDVLVSMTRPSLNAVALVTPNLDGQIASTGFDVLRCSGVEPRWIYFLVRTRAFVGAMSDLVQGALYPAVKAKDIRGYLIPLAPLNEQRRIAAKLDTTLAAVECCRQRLDGVVAILKHFRQAVLAAATSGELTREWREENGHNHDEWSFRQIDEIATEVFDGPFGSNLKSDDYTADGYRVVRLENLLPLKFLEEKRTYVSKDKFFSLSRHVLYQGDILFSSFIDEEVRTCLLPEALSGRSINKADCFCVRVDRRVCRPEFVVAALSCRSTFESLAAQVHGATRPRINLKQLKASSLRIPPLEEQDTIVQRIQELFTRADQLEVKLNSSLKIIERLTPALLAKAFLGELIPQDPSDEPASQLLAKLKAKQPDAAHLSPRRRAKQTTRRQKMSISDRDSIKAVILGLSTVRFSFDELRDQAGGDYESLKRVLFELLEEPSPVVRQVFDQEANAMRFERISP